MTIQNNEGPVYYLRNKIIPQLRNRNLYIAKINAPETTQRRNKLLKEINNCEETVSYLELQDHLDETRIMELVEGCIRGCRMEFAISHPDEASYPGTVICVEARFLTSINISNEFWRVIWELNNGMSKIDGFEVENDIFVVFSGLEEHIPIPLHQHAMELSSMYS